MTTKTSPAMYTSKPSSAMSTAALPQRASSTAPGFTARGWRPVEKNSLRGFFSLELPSGLVIRECCLHQKENARWVSLPARPWQKLDGTTGYSPMIDFKDAKTRFLAATREAVDKLLAEGPSHD